MQTGDMASADRQPAGRRFATHALRTMIVRAALLAALFIVAAMLEGALASPACARELRIRDFHAALDVLPDSSLDVTETIRIEFIGAWQGLYRTIPVEYPGPAGFNYSLDLSDITATGDGASRDSGGGGLSLRVDRRRQGANLELKIYVPNAEDTTRTISAALRRAERTALLPRSRRAVLEHYGNRVGRAH